VIHAQNIDLLNPLSFTKSHGLPSASVYGICQDGDGRIWVGTQNGLAYLENGTFHKVTNSALPSTIHRIYSIHDSILYVIGILPTAIIKMNTRGEILKEYQLPNGKFHGPLVQFSESEEAIYYSDWGRVIKWTEHSIDTISRINGTILVSMSLTPSNGVLLNKSNGFFTVTDGKEEKLSSHESPISIVSGSGDTLICNSEGIYRFSSSGIDETFHEFSEPMRHQPIIFLEDDDGGLWIAGKSGDLRLVLNDISINLVDLLRIDNVQFTCVFQDAAGNIWCGTNGNGLMLFKKSLFSTPIELFKFRSSNIISVFKPENAPMFVSTLHGLYMQQTSNDWLEMPLAYGEYEQIEVHTGVAFDSFLLFGSNYQADQGFWELKNNSEYTSYLTYAAQLKVFDNTLYVGAWSLFAKIKPHQMKPAIFRAAVLRNPLQPGRTNSICQVDSGIVVGTENSILYLPKDDSIFKPMPTAYSDQRSYNELAKTLDETLWVGSSKGLLKWNGNVWKEVNIPNFKNTKPIHALCIDKLDRMWFGGEDGLYMYYDDDLIHYSDLNGLPSPVIKCIYNGHTDKNDILWIGTAKGLITANITNSPSEYIFQNPIVFEKLSVYNGASFTNPKTLELGSTQNSFEISFSTDQYFAPLPLSYRYRLNGSSNEWQITDQPIASFQSLGPGPYSLEVQAKTPGSLWSESSKLNFTILLPFWKKWEFFLTIALGLTALIAALSVWRVRRIKRLEQRRRKLDQKIVELEYRALSAGMNPHFIFNALNSIQQFIIPLQSREALEYLGDVSNLIRLNMQALGKRVVSLADELNLIELYFRIENHRLQDRLHLKLINKLWSDPKLISIPPLLIQPLVENAIWHGLSLLEKGGEIRITLTETEDFVEIEVSDNGIGLEAAAKNRKKHHESVGLNTTEERLNHHHHKNKFKIEEVLDPKGIVLGTRACFRLYK